MYARILLLHLTRRINTFPQLSYCVTIDVGGRQGGRVLLLIFHRLDPRGWLAEKSQRAVVIYDRHTIHVPSVCSRPLRCYSRTSVHDLLYLFIFRLTSFDLPASRSKRACVFLRVRPTDTHNNNNKNNNNNNNSTFRRKRVCLSYAFAEEK